MAVVLVDQRCLAEPHAARLLARLQAQFATPAMLVARDDARWKGARARADFDAPPYLHALLGVEDLEWSELPDECEAELPF
ncbi:hypothetical protein OU994_18150 [Pseudoduganella sp. SL102]|uniref:hypothetical protein n=1 Tax=Pseudoduganella sp. SL102 TaxID=2995154 RepID=UPI00248D01B0|nr:hypothetical protein [Pseudoduganella sp. SL102]WBS00244.1 hypothetical protein OU994_18150 [Pseudoduganella sp. SL102]